MARKDRLAEVFSSELSTSNEARLPAGNPDAPAAPKAAPFGLNRYAAEHLQKPNSRYIQEIDPDLIDHGGPSDRMDEVDEPAEKALRDSIARTGQTTPVFLRPDPETTGRFRIIYGRRRVRALRALGQKVKAIIRDDVSEEDAVIIQGQENSVRKDLSFLERARFLIAIEDEGFPRSVAIDALSIDKARASNYAKVGRAVTDTIARLIGPAPGIGRDRWLAFVAACEEADDPEAQLVAKLGALAPGALDSDSRFALAQDTLATRKPTAPGKPAAADKHDIGLGEGKDRVVLATIKSGTAGLTVTIPARHKTQKDFAEHLKSRIDDLIRDELATWQKTSGTSD